MYPKIYLAIDNCTFYKRWTRPKEWAKIISGLGVQFIEASADTELDPLYMGKSYLENWIEQVKDAEIKNNVKVANLYSGHGTYTTLGLTHVDPLVRENMIENWFLPMINVAGKLNCGLGFYAHAFDHKTLQSNDEYNKFVEILIDGLSRINGFAAETKCGKIGIEQMYTPHQFPWRIKDTEYLLKEVTARSGRDFYFTEDVGHHHNKFYLPSRQLVKERKNEVWLGTDKAYDLAKNYGLKAWDEINTNMKKNPHLFSETIDSDCYETLKRLGCYSPIIHLQQTDGTSSLHLPFTKKQNKIGIIKGREVLSALKESYDKPIEEGFPERAKEIYLTLELFSGTTSIMQDVISDCEESVDYWRRFIPEDGIPLDQLLNGEL